MIDEKYVREYFPVDKFLRDIELGFTADEIVRGKYFLVTGMENTLKMLSKIQKQISVWSRLMKT